MRRSPKLTPAVWDGLVVLVVAVLAVASALMVWGGREADTDLTAVVSVDGTQVDRIELQDASGTRSYSGNGYTLTLVLCPDGQEGVRVEQADCPTQDCVHTGTITRAGQSIVCLPARIIIQLEGSGTVDDNAPDVIIG